MCWWSSGNAACQVTTKQTRSESSVTPCGALQQQAAKHSERLLSQHDSRGRREESACCRCVLTQMAHSFLAACMDCASNVWWFFCIWQGVCTQAPRTRYSTTDRQQLRYSLRFQQHTRSYQAHTQTHKHTNPAPATIIAVSGCKQSRGTTSKQTHLQR